MYLIFEFDGAIYILWDLVNWLLGYGFLIVDGVDNVIYVMVNKAKFWLFITVW